MTQYNFEWDPQKAKTNIIKHRVSFEEATTVFRDPNALSVYDTDHAGKEDRWITMGISVSGRLILVCHTYFETSEDTVILRLYSARKTTLKEKKQYRGEK